MLETTEEITEQKQIHQKEKVRLFKTLPSALAYA